MLKKLVSTGLLAASLMSMSGVVGASNVGNYQYDDYTAGFVNVKNLINGYANGTYPQDPATTGTFDYTGYDGSNYQDLYGNNWVSTNNKIKGDSNNFNTQTNTDHYGELSIKNKISGFNNQSNSMHAYGYSDSQVKNNIVGNGNYLNTQNVGYPYYDTGYYYYGDGVSTSAKTKNSIQSDHLYMPLLTIDGPVYPYEGNSANSQTSWAGTDAKVENNIGKLVPYYYYDFDGNLVEGTYVDGVENNNNQQSVYNTRTLANSKNKISGASNNGNGQYADTWADQNTKNNIYGYYNTVNSQQAASDLSAKNKNEINGLGNSANSQYGYSWADQILNNKVDGVYNNSNSQQAYSDTSVSGKNRIDGVGNYNNSQDTDSSAYTDVSNKVSGESNNGNRQYSESSNNVKSSNSIESWDNDTDIPR